MNKLLAMIICSVMAAPGFCQNVITESIPNSSLYVSFPSNWSFIRPYLGNGKYSSIQVNLPKGEHGGTPAYPEFDFEFLDSDSKDERLRKLLRSELSPVSIGGIEVITFTDLLEASYLHMDMSHSYATLQVTGYLVPINNGHLICTLTTHSDEESQHTKYISTLETYCTSAVESAKAPNKSLNSDAGDAGAP